MNRHFILLAFILYQTSPTFAQKVDLDRFYFDVNYQRLPREPVPFDGRVFGVSVKLGSTITAYRNEGDVYDKINIHGWKKTEADPTVGVRVELDDFVERGAKMQTRVAEEKNKEGKVISRSTFYHMESIYGTLGRAKISGPYTPEPPSKREVEEAKKKEDALTTNRFLKNAVIAKPVETPDATPLLLDLSGTLTYVGEEFLDAKKATVDFDNNRSSIFDSKLREFVDRSIAKVNVRVNELYGFTPVKDKELLWIMDAKGDEGEAQKEAIQAVKILFAEMKADEPIDGIKTGLRPLIDYFDSLKSKYTSSEKAARKIRYFSYFNLGKIYLMTDEPEKALKEAESLIANDYDIKDGELIIQASRKLMDDFERANTTSRHNPSRN